MTGALPAGSHALVIGNGRTGQAAARHLLGLGVAVRLSDARPEARCAAELEGEVEFHAGAESESLLAGITLVVPSPGVRADAPLLRAACAAGIPVLAEIELAAHALNIPLIAISGTNGKSTTTELVGAMLRAAGRHPFVGGNLGTPLVLATQGDFDSVVAEISSFQLEWVERFHPGIAALLNVSDDHLDRHGDLENYARLKARLFAHQSGTDVAVLNRDDSFVRTWASRIAGRVWTFGRSPLDGPGARIDATRILIDTGAGRHEIELAGLALAGPHNAENIAAAALLAEAAGVPAERAVAALRDFGGLPHRMETVADYGGVVYIDDSKGTNVGALCKALEGLPEGRVVLIAGGRGKGGDFAAARDFVASRTNLVAVYGEAAGELMRAWSSAARVVTHERFADAVEAAKEAARDGDTVLLSPACASQDQFRDYQERGNAFAAQVGEGAA